MIHKLGVLLIISLIERNFHIHVIIYIVLSVKLCNILTSLNVGYTYNNIRERPEEH